MNTPASFRRDVASVRACAGSNNICKRVSNIIDLAISGDKYSADELVSRGNAERALLGQGMQDELDNCNGLDAKYAVNIERFSVDDKGQLTMHYSPQEDADISPYPEGFSTRNDSNGCVMTQIQSVPRALATEHLQQRTKDDSRHAGYQPPHLSFVDMIPTTLIKPNSELGEGDEVLDRQVAAIATCWGMTPEKKNGRKQSNLIGSKAVTRRWYGQKGRVGTRSFKTSLMNAYESPHGEVLLAGRQMFYKKDSRRRISSSLQNYWISVINDSKILSNKYPSTIADWFGKEDGMTDEAIEDMRRAKAAGVARAVEIGKEARNHYDTSILAEFTPIEAVAAMIEDEELTSKHVNKFLNEQRFSLESDVAKEMKGGAVVSNKRIKQLAANRGLDESDFDIGRIRDNSKTRRLYRDIFTLESDVAEEMKGGAVVSNKRIKQLAANRGLDESGIDMSKLRDNAKSKRLNRDIFTLESDVAKEMKGGKAVNDEAIKQLAASRGLDESDFDIGRIRDNSKTRRLNRDIFTLESDVAKEMKGGKEVNEETIKQLAANRGLDESDFDIGRIRDNSKTRRLNRDTFTFESDVAKEMKGGAAVNDDRIKQLAANRGLDESDFDIGRIRDNSKTRRLNRDTFGLESDVAKEMKGGAAVSDDRIKQLAADSGLTESDFDMKKIRDHAKAQRSRRDDMVATTRKGMSEEEYKQQQRASTLASYDKQIEEDIQASDGHGFTLFCPGIRANGRCTFTRTIGRDTYNDMSNQRFRCEHPDGTCFPNPNGGQSRLRAKWTAKPFCQDCRNQEQCHNCKISTISECKKCIAERDTGVKNKGIKHDVGCPKRGLRKKKKDDTSKQSQVRPTGKTPTINLNIKKPAPPKSSKKKGSKTSTSSPDTSQEKKKKKNSSTTSSSNSSQKKTKKRKPTSTSSSAPVKKLKGGRR